jgi:hypothetical protein
MKTFKILGILIIILGIIYYQLDKNLFYYGRNKLHIYHLLPYNVEPDYSPPFEGGFALREEDGFSIAGKGVAYLVNNRKIWINDVLAYGFNKEHIVAVVIDSGKTKYGIKFNQDQKNISEISGTMMVDNDLGKSNLYKWIKIDGNDDYIWNLVLWRNCLMFTIFILLISLTYKLARYKKLKSTDSIIKSI